MEKTMEARSSLNMKLEVVEKNDRNDDEEIMDEIKEMVYLSRDKMPSFYRLKDGTIVMMLITIHHIVEDPPQVAYL